MRKSYFLSITITLLLSSTLLAACEQTQVATPEPVTVTISGATGMRPVLQALTSEFSRRHPSVIFDLRGGGSSIGEQLAESGEVNLGASLLPPPNEPNTADTAGTALPAPLFRVPIGIDGLAIVVHKSNLLQGLSRAELQDIFSGRIVNWSTLNAGTDDILLVSREDGSGARQLFESRIMGVESVSLTAVVMPTSADVIAFVARNPASIGYVSRAYVASELAQVDNATPTAPQTSDEQVKVLTLEGKLPTKLAIKEGSYLLSAPLFLVGKGELAGWERQFVEFILGPVGQQIVEKYHARVR